MASTRELCCTRARIYAIRFRLLFGSRDCIGPIGTKKAFCEFFFFSLNADNSRATDLRETNLQAFANVARF